MHASDNGRTSKGAVTRSNVVTSGNWWRFDRYRIDSHGSIVPAEQARLTRYAPWDDFRKLRKNTGTGSSREQPAYRSLMQLSVRLKSDRGGRYPQCVSEESRNLIVEWCQQHGPLGVLLSQWEALRLAEVRDPSEESSHRLFSRGFGREVQSNTVSGNRLDLEPRVFIRGWNDLQLVDEAPNRTWARFFPSVPVSERDRFQYPRPYTNKFCRLYGEPLSHFCRAAILLTNAILLLGQKRKQEDLACSQALYSLNVLRKPIDSLLDFDDQWNPVLRWTSPSLLASFAEMFVQDLMRGQAILICKSCGDPFTAQAYQSLYCGKTCGFRQQKRRQRQQFRDVAKLRAQGQGVRQIAATLKQEPKLIKSRLEKLAKLTGPKRGTSRLLTQVRHVKVPGFLPSGVS